MHHKANCSVCGVEGLTKTPYYYGQCEDVARCNQRVMMSVFRSQTEKIENLEKKLQESGKLDEFQRTID